MEVSSRSPLRTFTFSEMLDQAFRIYRKNFATMFVIVALVTVPLTALNIWNATRFIDRVGFLAGNATSNPTVAQFLLNHYGGDYFVYLLFSLLSTLLQVVLIGGPITYIASESLFGSQVSISQAFGQISGKLVKLGAALFILYLIIVVIAVASALTITLWCGFLGFVLVAYVGIAAGSLLTPVAILESSAITQSINRAFGLGKSRFWTVIGMVVVLAIILAIIGFALGLVAGLFIGRQFISPDLVSTQRTQLLLQAAISILVAPVSPIALTVLYYDTRIRREGLDIALQTSENPNARPSDVIAPPTSATLDGNDFRNMGIILVVGFLLALLIIGLIGGGRF